MEVEWGGNTLAGLLKQDSIEDAKLTQLSEMAAHDPSAGGNPIALDAKNLRGLFEASLEGRL